MRKIVYIHLIILLLLLSLCGPLLPHFDYTEQMCPLSRYNIGKAEALLEDIHRFLEEEQEQGMDISCLEEILSEIEELLKSARIYASQGRNCIAGNIYAIKAQTLYKEAQNIHEKRLSIQKEEYVIYSVLIETWFTDGLYYTESKYICGPVQFLIIKDHTVVKYFFDGRNIFESFPYVHEHIPSINQETFNDLKQKNCKEYPLENHFDLSTKVILLSEQDVKEQFPNDFYFDLYAKYPFSQGMMHLSRVGFNSNETQALVYIENYREILDAAGYFVLLVKENGCWIIQGEVNVWVS